MQKPVPVIFVIGPTASGKTAISYEIAKACGGQIINADVGQFYTPLSIGTAKPAWDQHVIKAHLFDICDNPTDFSVVQFRSLVLEKVRELQVQGIIPIVVGGSLFYTQSLFFPPKDLGRHVEVPLIIEEYSWDFLKKIDSQRASQIHPTDHYRVRRALDIWASSGVLPSLLEPSFNFNDPVYILSLTPEREILRRRIEERSRIMLCQEGWIEEARRVKGSEWEPFIRLKGLIGYDLLFDALEAGTLNSDHLISQISIQTWQYAKRQLTFLRAFTKKMLALKNQKKGIVLQQCLDYTALSYEQLMRLVAYLQK